MRPKDERSRTHVFFLASSSKDKAYERASISIGCPLPTAARLLHPVDLVCPWVAELCGSLYRDGDRAPLDRPFSRSRPLDLGQAVDGGWRRAEEDDFDGRVVALIAGHWGLDGEMGEKKARGQRRSHSQTRREVRWRSGKRK